jgi:tetratricopeptide (TPR) repeat protein
LLKNDQPELAAREYRAILALDPINVDARGNLGVVRFFQGNYAKAIPEFRSALHLRPALWKIQALLGTAEKRTRDMSDTRTDLVRVFPHVPEEKLRVETGMELIELYYGANDLDKASGVGDGSPATGADEYRNPVHCTSNLLGAGGREYPQHRDAGSQVRADAPTHGS